KTMNYGKSCQDKHAWALTKWEDIRIINGSKNAKPSAMEPTAYQQMTGCERAGPPAGDAAPGRSSARAEVPGGPGPGRSGPEDDRAGWGRGGVGPSGPWSGPDPAGPPGGIPRERTADTFPKLTVRRRVAPITGREPAICGALVAACPRRDRRVGRWVA